MLQISTCCTKGEHLSATNWDMSLEDDRTVKIDFPGLLVTWLGLTDVTGQQLPQREDDPEKTRVGGKPIGNISS